MLKEKEFKINNIKLENEKNILEILEQKKKIESELEIQKQQILSFAQNFHK